MRLTHVRVKLACIRLAHVRVNLPHVRVNLAHVRVRLAHVIIRLAHVRLAHGRIRLAHVRFPASTTMSKETHNRNLEILFTTTESRIKMHLTKCDENDFVAALLWDKVCVSR